MTQEKEKTNNANKIWLGILILFITIFLVLIFKLGFGFLFQWFGWLSFLIWFWLIFSWIILFKMPLSLYQIMIKFTGYTWFFVGYIFYSVLFLVLVITLSTTTYNSGITKNNKNNNNEIKQAYPFSIKLVSAPKTVNCYKEKSTLKIEVTNKGKNPFNFNDLAEDKYEIGICTKVGTCFSIGVSGNEEIEKFETIMPGQTRQIVFVLSKEHKNNVLGTSKDHQNKNYTYHIELKKVINKKKKMIVGISDKFTVFSNIMEKNSDVPTIKDCQ